MPLYPYRTGRPLMHRIIAVAVMGLGVVFWAVAGLFAVQAAADGFVAFWAVAALFAGFGAAGLRFGWKGWRAVDRLDGGTYGVLVEGDTVRSLAFDALGDLENSFRLSEVRTAAERTYDKYLYLHVELQDGRNVWMPTWRLDPGDRMTVFALVGAGVPRVLPRKLRPAAPSGTRPAPPSPVVPSPVVPSPVVSSPVVSSPVVSSAPAPVPVAEEDRDVGVYASKELLHVAAAWIATIEQELGVRLADVSERVPGRGFRFGRDEDAPGSPWLDVRDLLPSPATAYSGAVRWSHEFVLHDGRLADGQPFDLVLRSEELADAGWCWSASSDGLDDATLQRCRTRFMALHRGAEPVREDWAWLQRGAATAP